MTCFWDGLIRSFTVKRLNEVLGGKGKPSPQQFVKLLKHNNVKTVDVLWNDEELRDQELQENFDRIKELNIQSINRGYDCSGCDPFLLLISQLFKVDIFHTQQKLRYVGGGTIKYTNKSVGNNKKIIKKYGSNSGHFWHIK